MVANARRRTPRTDLPDLSHLSAFSERMGGAVQREEALLLYSLVRVLRPETVLDVGFLTGDSAGNFLRALDPDAHLYSFDVDPACASIARERFGGDPRFVFRERSQTDLGPADIEGRSADLVFLDASHELALNQATFDCLLPLMAPDALLVVHDTGTVPRELLAPRHWAHQVEEGWVGDEYEVMSGERAFANWLLDEHEGFSQVHLHSRRVARCGMTLLQRRTPLPRPT